MMVDVDSREFIAAGDPLREVVRDPMPIFWTGEDGEDYYATGHIEVGAMIAAVVEYERETVRAVLVAGDFAGVDVRHSWIRWITDEHGERGERVAPGTPGSEKLTAFSPRLDWDAIEARGDAIEARGDAGERITRASNSPV